MIARRLRPTLLRAALTPLVAVALLATACDKVPLTAPTESTITLFATATSVSPSGSTDIVANVIEQAGTPVQNGTVVSFTTTLGRIEPAEARTQNGKVTVKLTADGRSGVAQITAFSGGATSEKLELPIGSAAAETVTVRAEPARLPPGGGAAQIVALVRDVAGNPLAGASVAFTATAGTLSSGVSQTDTNGEARSTLTTARETTVTATVGARSGEATISVDGALGLAVAVSPDPPIEGRSATFTIVVTVPTGGNLVRRLQISFGDGETRTVSVASTGGTTAVAHTYGNDGTYTVSVTVTDSANNIQTQQLVINVVPAPPVTVSLTASTLAPTTGQIVVFTASASAGTGVTIRRYEWTLGDGSTQSTTANTISHSYGSAGQKLVKVTAIGSDDSEGLAQLVVTVS
ncbi:MAG: PKD domain-containing protein [Vicinamibacteria bacterium]|nr:PKD domain-containing protein [Vicinamibacteria bacterium]